MFKSIRLWKGATVAGLGFGVLLGAHWSERVHREDSSCQRSYCQLVNSNEASNSKSNARNLLEYYLPVPSVEASTALVPAGGIPQGVSVNKINSELTKCGSPSAAGILRVYDDFVLSYDNRNRIANWVFEHLTKEKVARRDDINREGCNFLEDASIHDYFRSSNEDYKGSGYDRGHMAAAANHRWSQAAMNQTFVLTNTSPQVGKGFNRDAWEQLERYVRFLARDFQNVYVCTGPLYIPRREPDGKLYVKYEVIGKKNVAVPTHFFKVVVMENNTGSYEMLSFVMPNQVLPDKVDLKKYLVPLDTIERASGFLFFSRIKNNFKKINGRKL